MIKFLPLDTKLPVQDIRFVHISDPHLSNLEHVSWRQLLNKRILGYLSWRMSRRFIHRQDVLNSLILDLDAVGAQHLLISGDLTHIGTSLECQQVANWLNELGSAMNISIIPGNHDRYTYDDPDQTINLWSDFMRGDTESRSGTHASFPAFRQRGPLAIISLSTALPTAPFFASGRLGDEQIEKMLDQLKHAKEMGLFRVLMLHHGPLPDSNKFRKRLIDAAEFRSAVSSTGAELILHGHGHYPVSRYMESIDGQIPVIGAASASVLSASETKRAGYNVFNIKTTNEGWKLQFQSRRYDRDDNTFKTILEQEFITGRRP